MNLWHSLRVKRIAVAIDILAIEELYAIFLTEIVELNREVVVLIECDCSIAAICWYGPIVLVASYVNEILCLGRVNAFTDINLYMKMLNVCLTVTFYGCSSLGFISNGFSVVIHMSSVLLTILFGDKRGVFLAHLFNGGHVTACINTAVLGLPNVASVRSSVRTCNREVA